MILDMTLGDKIKGLRLAQNMSQEELGEKLGVKKAAIHKYENNIVSNLKRSTIEKLSEVLHTTPAYLMGWDEPEEEQKEKFIDDDELESEALFKSLSTERRKEAIRYMRYLVEHEDNH